MCYSCDSSLLYMTHIVFLYLVLFLGRRKENVVVVYLFFYPSKGISMIYSVGDDRQAKLVLSAD